MENDNFVHVKLGVHEGTESVVPYYVEPRQTVIPGNGELLLTIWLQPSAVKLLESEDELCCNLGYALGFCSLEKHVQQPDYHTTRLDGHAVEPLRLEMTATIRKGRIHIEDDGEEFALAMSDVLCEQENTCCLDSSNEQLRSFVLTNTGESSMLFNIQVSYPYFILSDKTNEYVNQLARVSLPCGSNCNIRVGFQVSRTTLDDFYTLRRCGCVKGVTLECSPSGLEHLVYRSSLRAKFINGSTQHYQLEARVAVPKFIITRSQIDFGSCFVGQEVRQDIEIRNLSTSQCNWTLARQTPAGNLCTGAAGGPSDFRCTPMSGLLEPCTSNDAPGSTAVITAFFRASVTDEKQSFYLLKSQLSEDREVITLTARGSYDGAHEYK